VSLKILTNVKEIARLSKIQPTKFIKHIVAPTILGASHWTENEKKRSFIFFSLFDLKLGHSADNFFFQ
jgi:hypothetical protein